ncbi:MAG: hypothetical protein M0Q53_09760 [Prolixibacteraceae bacterium]|jgi:hypothetical protein|nr:hypothetical protein [Prolixibacteraceae bacterium]
MKKIFNYLILLSVFSIITIDLPARSIITPEDQIYQRRDSGYITLGNNHLEICLSEKDGTIRHLINKTDKVDYCNQVLGASNRDPEVPLKEELVGERIGGVMVCDDLAQKTFSDLAGGSVISNIRILKNKDGITCTFDKAFKGADFILRQSFTIREDHVRWELHARKIRGADRSLRLVQLLPFPTWEYSCWAPIAETIPTNPWLPFQVTYGQQDAGAVGNDNWRTAIPMMVFWSGRQKNALCLVNPFEIPAVRIRYRNNIGIAEDFHWNSRNYKLDERPYLQVISEYLGLRDKKEAVTGLLITLQPRDWRASLGWVYNQYKEYFDPAPGFGKYEGNYVNSVPYPDSSNQVQTQVRFQNLHDQQFVRWWEMHMHFPKYGEMVPPDSVKSWTCFSHPRPGYTNSREKIAAHAEATRAAGVGCFIYYNTTESTWWHARDQFPESIARDENGNVIDAFIGANYPEKKACWLMNSDPESSFGKDMYKQATEMVKLYPAIAGFFWDVYGRTYKFDFAHDDGITMVNNKPVYFPEFMFERMIAKVGPLLHGSGRYITCNKPTMVTGCKGIDGIMAREDTPAQEKNKWLVSQSYLGLNRYMMILDDRSWQHPERTLLTCLLYGYFFSDISQPTVRDSKTVYNGKYGTGTVADQKERALAIEKNYLPLIKMFKGRKWIFYPRALELPPMTDGNIFRLEDGSVMVTMVSLWRELNNIPGSVEEAMIKVRLPDAGEFSKFTLYQPDRNTENKIEPISRQGDTMTFRVTGHSLASVVVLRK